MNFIKGDEGFERWVLFGQKRDCAQTMGLFGQKGDFEWVFQWADVISDNGGKRCRQATGGRGVLVCVGGRFEWIFLKRMRVRTMGSFQPKERPHTIKILGGFFYFYFLPHF